MANVGLPGTSGFVGEFLTLLGTFKVNIPVATLATHRRDPVGVLRAVALSQGDLRQARQAGAWPHITDMSWREIAIFAPLVVLTLLFGFYPKPVLDMSAASVTALLEQLSARARRGEIRRAGEVRHCR